MASLNARHELHPLSGRHLAVLIVFSCVPFFNHVSLLVFLVSCLVLLWRLYGDRKGLPIPPRVIRWGVALLASAMIWREFKTFFGFESATSFLILLVCLKLLETVRMRDTYIIVFVSWMLAGCLQLFEQSTLYLVWGICIVLAGAIVLRLLQDPNEQQMDVVTAFKRIVRLFLLGLPIGILIFVVFPRFSIQTFGLNMQPPVATTGFTDFLDPGSVAAVAQTNEMIMRVNFENSRPNYAKLYWRGVVLDWSNGLKWERQQRTIPVSQLKVETTVTQIITLEPQKGLWMFGLDAPFEVQLMSGPPAMRIILDANQTLKPSRPLALRSVYKIRSHQESNIPATLSQEEHSVMTQVEMPERWPETSRFARDLRAKEKTTERIVQKVLHFFAANSFVYTLNPGVILGDSLDYFLFRHRKGFCEHYAAAMATILRLAGVPARIISGFHGGEYNDMGKFLLIRNRDAHSWLEYFSSERGWVRVDPVSMVASERIEEGAQKYFEKNRDLASNLGGFLGGFNRHSWFTQKWLQMNLVFEAMDYQITQFLLSFDLQTQIEILKNLGFVGNAKVFLSIIAGLVIILSTFLMFWWMSRKTLIKDPMQNLLMIARQQLTEVGFANEAWEGAQTLRLRLQKHNPELAMKWSKWFNDWQNLRYGREPISRYQIRNLRKQLR